MTKQNLRHPRFITAVMFQSLFPKRGDILEVECCDMLQNNWLCKSVTSVWQYCIMANYSWILMEGLYLHNLIFLALFSDTSSITLYVVLGWGK